MPRGALKLAIIGGGSSYTPELIEGVLKRREFLPVSEIHLVDIDQGREKLDIIHALATRMVAKVGADIKISASTDRREAIKGADFVMTQFRVGGLNGLGPLAVHFARVEHVEAHGVGVVGADADLHRARGVDVAELHRLVHEGAVVDAAEVVVGPADSRMA